MLLHISTQDGRPIYQQIVQQVKYLIAAEQVQPHEELPAVRVLAEQLLINPNTVARAYRELKTMGLVYKRPGAGTYVSDTGSPLSLRERRRILCGHLDALLAEARQMRFELEDVMALLKERAALLSAEPKEGSKS